MFTVWSIYGTQEFDSLPVAYVAWQKVAKEFGVGAARLYYLDKDGRIDIR